MMDEIKVSVYCAVYNHERYLRQCLDGFVTQKTNFKYEVIVHDDASTDRSPEIIREYEKKYPDIIKPIYQNENQYSKGVKIGFEIVYPIAKGKYIAICEGDDFWCDENKLQRQYDALEAHPEAAFCAHKVRCVCEDGKQTDKSYPTRDLCSSEISADRMLDLMQELRYPFQTSSYFIRKKCVENLNIKNMPKYMLLGGDLMMLLYFITQGNFFYLDEVMSCYRLNVAGSWSSRNCNKENQIALTKNTIAAYLLFDIDTQQRNSEAIKKIITQQIFYIFQVQDNYKMICDKKFKWVLEQYPLKQQIYYKLCAIVPQFEKIYRRVKSAPKQQAENDT